MIILFNQDYELNFYKIDFIHKIMLCTNVSIGREVVSVSRPINFSSRSRLDWWRFHSRSRKSLAMSWSCLGAERLGLGLGRGVGRSRAHPCWQVLGKRYYHQTHCLTYTQIVSRHLANTMFMDNSQLCMTTSGIVSMNSKANSKY